MQRKSRRNLLQPYLNHYIPTDQGKNVMKIWECKLILPDDTDLPDGADFPMREAVSGAVEEMTGRLPQHLFSGWGGKLTKVEKKVIGAFEDYT